MEAAAKVLMTISLLSSIVTIVCFMVDLWEGRENETDYKIGMTRYVIAMATVAVVAPVLAYVIN